MSEKRGKCPFDNCSCDLRRCAVYHVEAAECSLVVIAMSLESLYDIRDGLKELVGRVRLEEAD
jgi:hypothetical protein